MRPFIPPLPLSGLRGPKVSPRVGTAPSSGDRVTDGAVGPNGGSSENMGAVTTGGAASAGRTDAAGFAVSTDGDTDGGMDDQSDGDGDGIDGAAGFVQRPMPGSLAYEQEAHERTLAFNRQQKLRMLDRHRSQSRMREETPGVGVAPPRLMGPLARRSSTGVGGGSEQDRIDAQRSQ